MSLQWFRSLKWLQFWLVQLVSQTWIKPSPWQKETFNKDLYWQCFSVRLGLIHIWETEPLSIDESLGFYVSQFICILLRLKRNQQSKEWKSPFLLIPFFLLKGQNSHSNNRIWNILSITNAFVVYTQQPCISLGCASEPRSLSWYLIVIQANAPKMHSLLIRAEFIF